MTSEMKVRFSVVAALMLASGLLTGCAPTPHLDWSALDAPAGTITALAPLESALLVGESTSPDAAGATTPRLYRLAAGTFTPVEVSPTGPYGALASWTGFAVGPDAVAAVGGARGGAHANVRWSVWRASRDAAGALATLSEQAQTFETFGGWDAGALVGVAWGPAGPVIAGSWKGSVGLDIALWTADGARWSRVPVASELASTPEVLRKASAVAATPTRLVLVGDEIDLAHGVGQAPIVWTAPTASGPWSRLALPGAAGRAVAVGCSGESCVVVGVGRDAVARAWRLTGAEASELVLPMVTIPAPAAVPAPVVVGGIAWLALPTASGTTLLRAGADGVRALDAPAGRPVALAAVGDRLYLAQADASGATRLWNAPTFS